LAGLLLSATLLWPQTPGTSPPTQAARVDELLKEMDRSDAPGCVVAAVKDGKIVYQHAAGMANLEFGIPLTLTTLFLIASLSKQFTVFALMLLVQQGRLSLDDDVRKHVPELPSYGKTITVRHLVHHTSGLREETLLMQFAGLGLEDVISHKDIINLICRQKELNFEPGAEHLYCNSGYELLGLIVQRVSGKSLREFTRKEMFEPLGMKDTFFRDDPHLLLKNTANSYQRSVAGWQPSFTPYGGAGATNIHTTVPDLALWDENFYTHKVGGQAVFDLMYTRGKLNDGTQLNYAGGLVIGSYRGQKTVHHSGGHGGFRTVLLRFPEHHFSAIVLSNAGDFNPMRIAENIADISLEGRLDPVKKDAPKDQGKEPSKKDETKAKPKDVKVPELTADQLRAFAGDYYSEELDIVYHLVVKDDRLMLRQRKGEWPLRVTGDGEFSCNLAGATTVQCLRDDMNHVTGFTIGTRACRNLRFVRLKL
jgi:CubicO group peptidase (beta-lactamase class C family)